MPVTGKHSIRSLGARPTEAAENLKSVCDGGAIETVVEKATDRGAPPTSVEERAGALAPRRAIRRRS